MAVDDKYLQETFYIDFTAPELAAHLDKAVSGAQTDEERIADWYLYVRDAWRYNPYNIYLTPEKLRVSDIVQRKECHCIDKSLIFIAGLRKMGIPARLHLAKVCNHISADRIKEKLGTDELAPHGYAAVHHNGQWTKASPIFDKNLCRFLNVDALDYDGTEDAIFQEYDKAGGMFMEYLEDYGHYDDLPLQRMKDIMKEVYPHMVDRFIKVIEAGEPLSF